ncbi:MAG: helix-turn-helix domain-containing protein [Planctomycetota bacterium]|nr:helix-turn-helix domain-containing protein [Planctomycetota bacterium]
MGKMEQALKSEIVRLAKKQVRAICLPLARDVRRLKRTVSALRKTVAVLASLGTELQAERQAQRAKLAVAPDEVKAARLSPALIKKLRTRLGITQGELATLVGVSTSAVGSWEYGKAKPEGHNREALVALRKLGRREMAGILATKAEETRLDARGKGRRRRRKNRR